MTNADLAVLANRIWVQDLRARIGFGSLIASTPDWAVVEAAMQKNLERELDNAKPTEDVSFLQ